MSNSAITEIVTGCIVGSSVCQTTFVGISEIADELVIRVSLHQVNAVSAGQEAGSGCRKKSLGSIDAAERNGLDCKVGRERRCGDGDRPE